MNTRQSGFTLIELVVALTISAIVVGFVAMFVSVPVQAHFAQARRSELAASAEAVTQWMSQDVRGALPNSVRAGLVGGRAVVEMIDVAAVGIYRDAGLEGDPLVIDPTKPPDNQFDILGLPAAAATHVVVDNRGTVGHDAYAMADVIAPANVNTASSTIALTPPFRFAGGSTTHRRAFLVSPATAVIRYECDTGAGTLRRYGNLPVTAGLAALPGGTPSLLIASNVTACTFTPQVGNAEHGGLLLIQVTISRVTNGAAESLRVMKQLKVEEAA
jgi:prepilin-type N-terminal cleavage/methylation domain-containing protein